MASPLGNLQHETLSSKCGSPNCVGWRWCPLYLAWWVTSILWSPGGVRQWHGPNNAPSIAVGAVGRTLRRNLHCLGGQIWSEVVAEAGCCPWMISPCWALCSLTVQCVKLVGQLPRSRKRRRCGPNGYQLPAVAHNVNWWLCCLPWRFPHRRS
jgi:hypothetical protein